MFWRAGLALAASLGLAACATGANHQPATLPEGAAYVALGSSFAAGAGIGPTKPGTPERCGRTVNNYASLLAEKLHLSLNDQSCGGATSDHVLGPWDELPPQIDAVNADTRLVTVTVGGNDLNYVGNLFAASCDPATGMKYQGKTYPCSQVRLPVEADVQRLESSLRDIALQVKARAPEARLVFVQYVTLVPQEMCEATQLSPSNAEAIRAIGLQLAQATAKVARETGSLVLSADEMSRAHSPCAVQPWSVGAHARLPQDKGAPWHPNADGHSAIAEALAKQIRSAG